MSDRGGRGGGRNRGRGSGDYYSREQQQGGRGYGGDRGGGHGHRGGRGGGGENPREPQHGGHGYGFGRGGGGDFPREPQPRRQGHGGGGRGGRDRGGGGGGPLPRREQQPAPQADYQAPPPPPVKQDQPSPSSSSSLVEEVERKLNVKEAVPSGSAATEAQLPVAPPPASTKALRHPARPGFGTAGRKLLIRANHFLVHVADNDLYHYDVAITPEVTLRSTNRRIISELLSTYGESHLGKKEPVYDGRKSLFTAGALPFESKVFIIRLSDQKGDAKREKEYKVAIKLAGRADLHHLKQFLQGRQADSPQDTIQVLDVVLRQSPSTNYVTVARSFFSPDFGHRREIGDGLECWRGFYQSLRPTQMGLSLNIDISATSFYKPVPVVDFVCEYLSLRDPSRPLSDQDRVKIKKALRGVRIEVTHRNNCTRRYKITSLSSLPMNQLMFPVDERGTKVSVVEYFRDRYNYILKYVRWPCLQAGSDSNPTYLPMEVCKLVEGQRFAKKLNERQVTAILRATCQRPHEREASIIQMVNHNNYNEDKYANVFGIRVDNQLVSVEARVLPPPRLKYHESGKEKMCNPNVGQWNMINKKMVNGGTVDYWTCICFSRIGPDMAHRFCYELVNMCRNIGMNFNHDQLVDIQFARPDRLESALRDVHRLSTEALAHLGQGKHLQLLIVVLPDMTGSYGKIKRICETELGIVSQCCLPKHVSQCKPQYLENVALKINVKVGGRNTVLEDAINNRIPLVTDRPTIIFGADVTHPPPGEDTSASIAAVVASMDWPEVTKYRGLVSAQPHRQEMIDELFTVTQNGQKGTVYGGMIRELLIAFRRATGHRPHRIIFYRDGVSEGQFSHVLLYEMDAIRKACASLEEGYLPPVTFVVVQKRHHTRLFPGRGSRDTDRSGNILPGTVVDRQICHPTEFDFYLCSHAGIQGTSRPTHYHVLLDENQFSADGLQILTNNLCYTYARCTRSVSVVPPAYYAHLAAFRARYYAADGEATEGSSTGDINTRGGTAGVRPLPRIKDNVKEVMFYC